MRYMWIAAGMAVLAMLGACKKEKPVPPPTVVTVSPVISGVIADSLQLIGQVKACETVNIVARVKGFLTKQNFQEGDYVKKGTLLYEIEPYQYEADLQTAIASHEKALADKKNADSDYARQEALYKGDAVSERVRDEALARKMEADAEVKATAAAIDNAKLQLSYTKIYAPFDGRVGLVTYSVGNVVSAESGTLVTMVTTDPIDVSFSINEVSLLKVMKAVGEDEIDGDAGARVRLFLQDGMEYNLEGKITKWDNRVNPMTGMLMMQAQFSNPNRILIDGMYMRVRVEPKVNPKSLLIPRQAIQESQDAKYVMVVDKDNVVARKSIKMGTNDELFVVIEGLAEGENVIIEGIQKVRPKMKVAPKVDERYVSQAAAAELYKIKKPEVISFANTKKPRTSGKETKPAEAAKPATEAKPAEAAKPAPPAVPAAPAPAKPVTETKPAEQVKK